MQIHVNKIGMNRDILIIHLLIIFTFLSAELYGKKLMKIAHLNRLTLPSWNDGKVLGFYILIVCKTFNENYF